MFTPHLYREFLKYATPDQRAKLLAMPVIEGDGAMGRIMLDSYAVLEQLPAFTPPFNQLWIELGKMTLVGFEDHHNAAVVVTAVDVRDEKQSIEGQPMGWMVDIECYVDTVPAEARTYMGRLELMLTSAGELPKHPKGGFAVGELKFNPHMMNMLTDAVKKRTGVVVKDISTEEWMHEVEYGIRRMIEACALSALFVMGMLHCKNVELEEQIASAKVQRHRAKHGKSTDERFYTLKVTGKGARAGSLALRVPSGARNAMHWCRGHFRTYTDDAPLFGKVTGTFWVDAHVRGDRAEGAVNKAYTVDLTQPIPHGRAE